MKSFHIYTCSVLLFVIFCLGCETQKKLLELGKQQIELGMYGEATETLLKALAKKKSNLDVQVTLRNTMTLYFETQSERVSEAYQTRMYDAVIQNYKIVDKLRLRAENLGVKVDIPVKMEKYYSDSKNAVVEQKIIEGNTALERKDYDAALKIFRYVLDLEPKNEIALEGAVIAINEPQYQSAQALYEQERYRSAYAVFKRITGYKNAAALANMAFEKGQAIFLFTPADVNNRSFCDALYDYVLHNKNSPFLIPYSYIEKREWLQSLGCNHYDLVNFTKSTPALFDVGKIHTIAVISPVAWTVKRGVLEREHKEGFEIVKVEKKDREGKKYYVNEPRRVRYTIVITKAPQEVSTLVNLRLMTAKSGQIYSNKNYTETVLDHVKYIEYDGKIKSLKAGYWGSGNKRDSVFADSHRQNREIQSLANARSVFQKPEDEVVVLTRQHLREIEKELSQMTLKD